MAREHHHARHIGAGPGRSGLDRLAALLRIDLRGTDGYGMLSGILAWAGDDDERLLMSSTTPELTAREA
jgi:hypothetical protein